MAGAWQRGQQMRQNKFAFWFRNFDDLPFAFDYFVLGNLIDSQQLTEMLAKKSCRREEEEEGREEEEEGRVEEGQTREAGKGSNKLCVSKIDDGAEARQARRQCWALFL